jgi:hypothetical protein
MSVKKAVKISGGGTEGEEYVACSVKVMLSSSQQWRIIQANKVFTDIQTAVNSLA